MFMTSFPINPDHIRNVGKDWFEWSLPALLGFLKCLHSYTIQRTNLFSYYTVDFGAYKVIWKHLSKTLLPKMKSTRNTWHLSVDLIFIYPSFL